MGSIMEQKISINEKEYRVIKLLGKGKGGYSYLVTNLGENYVLKQIHHEPYDYYQFGNKLEAEIRDYYGLMEIGITMPKLIEYDTENERILKEYIQGDTIDIMVSNCSVPKTCYEQIEIMCDKLYKANTNIDYYPTNFVLQDNVLYYIDYECNDYSEEWNFENWGIKYWEYNCNK